MRLQQIWISTEEEEKSRMHAPLFEMRHVEISYYGIPVVHDISLQLREGEILGIVGESGSGKSTLLKAAMGLLGRTGAVTRGDILYRGENILDIPPDRLRMMRGPQMGMVFQNAAASLCPIRTIEDQLYESMAEHESVRKQQVRDKAMEIFEKLRLKEGERILKSYPFELSGGMNQRVGIALAMLLKPALLFADEPTSALDVTVQAEAVKEMMRIRQEFGTAIVLVTHNIGLVKHMADKAAVMYQGELVEYGSADSVIKNPQKEYTKRLIEAVPRLKRG